MKKFWKINEKLIRSQWNVWSRVSSYILNFTDRYWNLFAVRRDAAYAYEQAEIAAREERKLIRRENNETIEWD